MMAVRPEPALSVQNLTVAFDTPRGTVRAVSDVSFDVAPGEMLAIVGETGSGKSTSVLAALGLLAGNARVSGSVDCGGVDLLGLSPKERRRRLGTDIAMVFQDPFSSLNPVLTVGRQVAEAVRTHHADLPKDEIRRRAIELLESVGIPEAPVRYRQWPHELSGGLCQRVGIAMALANRPKVLVADEPTTALDVTVQAQILELLRKAQLELGAATVLITHDLGLVAQMADRVCIMYGGRVVELSEVGPMFANPSHPYTAALLASIPRLGTQPEYLLPIPGSPPDPGRAMTGCAFEPRCRVTAGRQICQTTRPELRPVAGQERRVSACHFAEETVRPAPEVVAP